MENFPLPLSSFLKVLPEASRPGRPELILGWPWMGVCVWVGGGQLSGSWLRVVFVTHLVQTFVPTQGSAGSF